MMNVSINFREFLEKSFTILNPGDKWLPNWHIDAMIEALRQVEIGNITRLIINIPPRYLKSICVSAAWTAWLLANKPTRKIICTSYSLSLSLKHSLDSKIIMMSEWYKKLFPKFEFFNKQNDKKKYMTSDHGFRLATSVNGSITGEGGDILIADDPHNPVQINYPKYRRKVIDWFEQCFASRLNNKKTGAIIIIMQRLHQEDIVGYLTKKSQNHWFQLNFPVIANFASKIKIGDFSYFRKKNELLHPIREGEKEIERAKLELGEVAFNAQYQQSPIVNTSQMIKNEWLQYYDTAPIEGEIVHSWDTAIKTGEEHDYSVCTVWKITGNNYYLIDIFRGKLSFPELKKKLLYYNQNYLPEAILIEDKASGQSLIQELAKYNLPVEKIRPVTNKLVRFAAITSFFANKQVFLPSKALWLADFLVEISQFPQSEHDDQVDSCSQFLNWINKINLLSKPKLRQF